MYLNMVTTRQPDKDGFGGGFGLLALDCVSLQHSLAHSPRSLTTIA